MDVVSPDQMDAKGGVDFEGRDSEREILEGIGKESRSGWIFAGKLSGESDAPVHDIYAGNSEYGIWPGICFF